SENPGGFYTDSVAAARALGKRSLVLTPQTEGIPTGPDVLVRAFVPHEDVFPSASVVVHHGGIGTTGQALMAGRPQLVVPHFGDQPDNGARLERLGVGQVIASTAYNAKTAEVAIGALLAADEMADRAQNLAKTIAHENGAQSAADAIMDLIGH
ncbi:MAG: nucleotide disphospho-sugar-binding domain-containing protein, partial [Pseudomonadota bacterium]